jgi:hypothetical protein
LDPAPSAPQLSPRDRRVSCAYLTGGRIILDRDSGRYGRYDGYGDYYGAPNVTFSFRFGSGWNMNHDHHHEDHDGGGWKYPPHP